MTLQGSGCLSRLLTAKTWVGSNLMWDLC